MSFKSTSVSPLVGLVPPPNTSRPRPHATMLWPVRLSITEELLDACVSKSSAAQVLTSSTLIVRPSRTPVTLLLLRWPPYT